MEVHKKVFCLFVCEAKARQKSLALNVCQEAETISFDLGGTVHEQKRAY